MKEKKTMKKINIIDVMGFEDKSNCVLTQMKYCSLINTG
jgi:hypothetical protein